MHYLWHGSGKEVAALELKHFFHISVFNSDFEAKISLALNV